MITGSGLKMIDQAQRVAARVPCLSEGIAVLYDPVIEANGPSSPRPRPGDAICAGQPSVHAEARVLWGRFATGGAS